VRVSLKLCVVITIIFCLRLTLFAQVTGSITGTVRDTSGAVVPHAKVSVFNTVRGIHRDTVSNASGEYLVQGLGEGTYSVKVTSAGFKAYLAENTVLRVGQNARVDAQLSVGNQTTEVTVQGSSAGIVETQSSELSTTITSKQISQLELNGRSFTQLIELSPGVSNQTGTTDPVQGPGQGVSYSVNGGRTEYNNWEIDGGDVLDSGSMSNLNVLPNVDALDQVQVLTSSYDAQYGRSGSGAIEAVTKSGTNQFHGEAFEYLRNQFFNAKNYFNTPGQRIGAYKKHDFGGTIGGPIIKDKLFFFYSEELRRQNVPGFYSTPVPSIAERAGDFNALCPTAGTVFYRSTTNYPDCPAYMADSAGDGGLIGFPNNNVAPYIDKANAGTLLSYIPTPTTTLNNLPYYREPAGAPYNSREELFKIDYNVSSTLHASFRFIHDAEKLVFDTSTPFSASNLPGIPGQQVQPGVSIVANLLWTPSSTLTNEFMVGYGANHIDITNLTSAANLPPALTLTSFFANGFGGKVPSFNINGGASFGNLHQDAGPTPFNNSNPTYTYRDTITKLLHSHNLKTGFYFTANQKNEDVEENVQGNLTFSGNVSSTYMSSFDTDGNPPSTGNSFTDFLVGDINNFYQANVQPKYHFQFKIFEPFIQDDWRATKNLTLNLGFRMSMFGLYTEKNNLAYNFDPTAYNEANMPTVDPNDGHLVFSPGQSISNLSGVVRCGFNGTPKGCMTGHIWNPAPRIGFAYDPFGDGKTAIRAAYGVFFEHTNGNEANAESLEGQPPLVLVPSQSLIQGYTHIGGSGEYFPLSPNSIPTKVQWPYVQQYHFDIQRQITRATIATVSYVGSKGTHLTRQYDLNQLHDLPASENPFAPGVPITDDVCNNLALSNGTPITGDALLHLNIACGNVNQDAFRQNYPGWSTIDRIDFGANSSYNALQVSARRTAKDLEVTFAYTYSHAIDDSSDRYDGNFVDSYNLKANRASSNFDQRHILNFSYIYTLPTLSRFNRLTRSTLGGWQWSGITEIQTGDPVSITNGAIYDNAGVANGEGTGSYVDVAPGVNKKHIIGPKTQAAIYGPLLFNPAAYNEPTGLTFGNSGRNSLHGPRTSNFDMGIFKHFPIHEAVTAEFRAEAFNVFNHTQFTSLNTGYSFGINNSPGCFGPNAGFAYNAGNATCVQGDESQGILPSGFLHPGTAHDPRIVQFALKILF
jgi:Carboxypeptidase regulatory-like domain/TonB-dependent Receptor Plug Domain